MFDVGTAVIETEDLIVGLALLAHHSSTDLTETNAMTPAGAM